MNRPAIFFAVCFFGYTLNAGTDAFGQSSTYVDGESRRVISWNDLVGSIVEVDGLAWGAASKGVGAHLVLPEGKVYLRNIDLVGTDFNGRLFRVVGVLRKTQTGVAPKGVQGYSRSWDYFYIEAIEAARIDKIVRHQVLPSPHDWIVTGMPVDRAIELIQTRRLSKYGLALAASPDGARTHAYQLSGNDVLVFDELDGRVKSVAKIKVSGIAKGADQWTHVPGLRLPIMSKGEIAK